MASNVVCPICRRYDDDCRCDRHTARDLQAQLQATQQREARLVAGMKELAMLIRNLPVRSGLDEDIPDDDKERAYQKGYMDALIDAAQAADISLLPQGERQAQQQGEDEQ